MKIVKKDNSVVEIYLFKQVKVKSKMKFFLYEDMFYCSIFEYHSGIEIANGMLKQQAEELLKSRLKQYGDDYIQQGVQKLLKKIGIEYPLNS